MPPYHAFRDPVTGEVFTREMTEAEYAAFPNPADILNSSTPKPLNMMEVSDDVD